MLDDQAVVEDAEVESSGESLGVVPLETTTAEALVREARAGEFSFRQNILVFGFILEVVMNIVIRSNWYL